MRIEKPIEYLKQHRRQTTIFVSLLLCVFLNACAGTPLAPQKPTVTVLRVKPVSLSGNQQSFLFTLNVSNPNSFPLPVEKISLDASFADHEVASGESTSEVSIPAAGDAQIDIEITTQLKDLFSRFLESFSKGDINLNYALNGGVKIKNIAKAFPFKTSGNLLDGGDD